MKYFHPEANYWQRVITLKIRGALLLRYHFDARQTIIWKQQGKYSALQYFSRLENIIYKLGLFEIFYKSIDVLNTF